jgi:hypothetical protein
MESVYTIPFFPEFISLGLEHKEAVSSILMRYPPEISEHNFTNLFIWQPHYGFKISRFEEGLLCLAEPEDGEPFFLPPLGIEQPLAAVFACLDYLRERRINTGVQRVGESLVKTYLEADSRLAITQDRDHFDYVYLSENLIHLRGRAYHRKKNHLNRFIKKYDFEYRRLTEDMLEDCFRIVKEWCEVKHCDESPALRGEEEAIKRALTNMGNLSFRAGALIVEGKLEAFALGEPLNPTTVVIHIEKANADIQGIYAAINQQFCEHEWSEFEFVNREQDLGEEGLRRAKESYEPHHYVKKYTITLR